MNVSLVPVASLKPYLTNPRHNEAAVDAVVKSIREFGFRQPIVVDAQNVIVVGHTRWKAAQQLGLTEVPVHVADNLSPAQAKAYRLADNQTATIAEWNLELLPAELAELKAVDFDMDLLGWTPEELTELMAPPENLGLVDPDSVPEPPDEPVTQPGDLWILGEHRLLCGDGTLAHAVNPHCGNSSRIFSSCIPRVRRGTTGTCWNITSPRAVGAFQKVDAITRM